MVFIPDTISLYVASDISVGDKVPFTCTGSYDQKIGSNYFFYWLYGDDKISSNILSRVKSSSVSTLTAYSL